MKDFNSSLSVGDAGEAAFKSFCLASKGVTNCIKMNYVRFDYDFLILLDNKSYKTAEIKSLAGGSGGRRYNTFVVEVWADNAQTRRPHWWADAASGKLDLIVFISRFDKIAYFFNPQILVEKLSGVTEFCRAADGNQDDSGWIVKVEWESSDLGFKYKRDFSKYL